ncbi:hypothetical protein OR263_12130 [Streptomyces sp. NEAU-H22]|uniref:hypothetical protein n=1 Tax=unclassified Streptomyces TaxID=2593676 RepID=UPI0022533091|nr:MULTISPECIES: hypothetical protein [unclassified Streptomyces]MCX3287447.1 hypothetical protein [Streptomyces sp. NEAU-H22]WMD09814.1 hypothetical protein Q7C01_38130 [Streptomyces sp. FXY-T5]
MTNTKSRTAAMITPVGQEAQDEARALASDGRTGKAVRRLRKDSWLKRGPAREALALLVDGQALPTSSGQALDVLRRLDGPLVGELSALLEGGRQIAAVKLLRERTGIDLAGGYHLVVELGSGPGTH